MAEQNLAWIVLCSHECSCDTFFLNCKLLVIGTFTSVNDIVEDKMSHQFSGQGSDEKKCVYPAISINLYRILIQIKIYININ